jgi:hypothetical protein
MTKVTAEFKENIYLRPNDVLTLIRMPSLFDVKTWIGDTPPQGGAKPRRVQTRYC